MDLIPNLDNPFPDNNEDNKVPLITDNPVDLGITPLLPRNGGNCIFSCVKSPVVYRIIVEVMEEYNTPHFVMANIKCPDVIERTKMIGDSAPEIVKEKFGPELDELLKKLDGEWLSVFYIGGPIDNDLCRRFSKSLSTAINESGGMGV